MTEHYDDQASRTAEELSQQVNTPSTSAMENNENDLHLKSDKAAFQEVETDGFGEELDFAESSSIEENPWYQRMRGASMLARASFADQIDYYDPDRDEIV